MLRLLIVNAGSSTLKLSVVDEHDRLLAARTVTDEDGSSDERAVAEVIAEAGGVDAVGHRVVHGGRRFAEAVVLDDEIYEAIKDLTELAPLHQPKSLAGIDAVRRVLPDVTTVACFDTAFHAHLPPGAATYALPRAWRERHGLRRYGFHGLSHAYVSRRACEVIGLPLGTTRLVTCHLGAGASLAAVTNGRSVDTTMGFTPLEGLVMATRSGTVDPGLVLWLQQRAGLSAAEVFDALEHRSGLAGLAGTPDMRSILQGRAAGEPDAALALDVYLWRLRGAIAAMVAALGGLDVLVFTGGVGERAPEIRAEAAVGLGWLGVKVDDHRNTTASPDADVSAAGSPVVTLVIAAREDLEIARQVRAVVTG